MTTSFTESSVRFGSIRRALWISVSVGLVSLCAACGGGTRGTGIYGIDGMRPGTLFEDGSRAPQRVEPMVVSTPTPTPRGK